MVGKICGQDRDNDSQRKRQENIREKFPVAGDQSPMLEKATSAKVPAINKAPERSPWTTAVNMRAWMRRSTPVGRKWGVNEWKTAAETNPGNKNVRTTRASLPIKLTAFCHSGRIPETPSGTRTNRVPQEGSPGVGYP